MKIIQLNAWLGRLSGPLLRFIEVEKPDILCLQEAFLVDKNAIIPPFVDQYDFLRHVIAAGDFNAHFFAKNWEFELGGTTVIEGGTILSTLPMSNQFSKHTYGHYHSKSTSNNGPANTRIWQSCQLAIGDKKLSIANYQGYLDGKNSKGNENTLITIKKVLEFIDSLSHPLIICGDFNISPDSTGIKLLNESGLRNLTALHNVPSTLSTAHRAPLPDRDTVACDYIFVSEDIIIKRFQVSDAIVSDHKALILEFDL